MVIKMNLLLAHLVITLTFQGFNLHYSYIPEYKNFSWKSLACARSFVALLHDVARV